ncbi:phosphoadenylyl-sulfate reductase [Fimbriimonas ginsengisoli]|uniref:Adenosine 5'-phosphosulfate reductase n=1 Tax=Fimbriimonas ginsengisoli Gsoil 348 TaxID=661478 RepID=A0A068NLN8_FIMGI|nr:phosphoadenylyl-sulfate reductase [Fimbriimonas ginsengisoli]AIE84332.1 phosphoadenosine phosphosulfate reductase [Fimbriimonas ginsengisoli Gsoil 348]
MIAPTSQLEELQSRLNDASAEEILRWAGERFGAGVAFASSFGAEDVVLIDLIAKVAPAIPIFVLDTGRLHQETYDVMERSRERYGIEFETYSPQTEEIQNLLRNRGPNSFYRSIDDRKLCCEIRKVEPLRRALSGRQAWITGLRRAQAVTRATLPKVEIDATHGGIFKLNPLADWSEEQVWAYIRANDVPYNALHDRGFPSIGCAPCTRAIAPGEDVRAGRWWWEAAEHKECGLHVKR